MLKLSRSVKAFVLFSLLWMSLITRILIGHGAFSNPIHHFSGPSLESSSLATVDLGETIFHSFKLKRKISLEALNHITWHYSLPGFSMFNLVLMNQLIERSDPIPDLFLDQRFRPPTHA